MANRVRWPCLDCTIDDQGSYRASDRWPAAVATNAIGLVFGIDRCVIARQSRESADG